MRPLAEEFLGRNAQIAYGVLAATVLALLLIACANVANLILSRGLTRQQEIAVRVALGASIMPALQMSRVDVSSRLREVSSRALGARQARRSQAVLLTGQIAIAVLLVVVTGLLVRTLMNIESIADQGFDPRGVLTARITLPESKYSPTAASAFFEAVVRRIASNGSVALTSAISRVPAAGSRYNPNRSLVIEGRPVSPRDPVWALDLTVMPRYFDVLRIPLLEGRDLNVRDGVNSPFVVVINHTMATRYWSGRSPIGASLRLGDGPDPNDWRTVIGVAGDVRNDKITDAPLPQVYVPLTQRPTRTMTFVVRGNSDPTPSLELVRSAVTQTDRDQPVYQVETMEQVLDDDLAGSRSLVQLFGVFAMVAVILAAAGVYAVVSFTVAARAPEVGVRITLGASRTDVLSLVVRQCLRPIALGLIFGLSMALAASQLIASVLYRTAPTDPVTYAGAALLFGAVAVIAALGPAIRATRVDPMLVLRAR